LRAARRAEMRDAAAKLASAVGAVSLVISFFIASMLSPLLNLMQLLALQWPGRMTELGHAIRSGTSLWWWEHVAIPLLVRPAWLLPAMIGMICVGLAVQLSWAAKRR